MNTREREYLLAKLTECRELLLELPIDNNVSAELKQLLYWIENLQAKHSGEQTNAHHQ
jgi:hypothetical protein